MNRIMRLWHIWGSVISLFAIVIFFTTGYFMKIRRDAPLVMPSGLSAKNEQGKKLKYQHLLTHEEILTAVMAEPKMGVKSWDDIYHLDWRPKKSMVKVKANNLMEAQVNTVTGEVEVVSKRNYDWISRLHAVEMVGPNQNMNEETKLDLTYYFLISSFIFLFLIISGVYLWLKKMKTIGWKSLLSARGLHLWLTPIIVLPLLITALSGLVLQAKHYLPESFSPNDEYKQIKTAAVIVPKIEIPEFLKILKTDEAAKEANIKSWKDVWRVYTYPRSGHMVARVYNKHDIGYEVRINSVTGEVQRAIPRYTDWIEDIHEGRFFENKNFRWMSWGVFLSIQFIFILSFISGLILLIRYLGKKSKSKRKKRKKRKRSKKK